MKIAVPYANEEVFQHFGHTEAFKVYEVEEGKILSAQVIENETAGHDALAGLLQEWNVDVVICGGIGQGAQAALAQNGIELCSGVVGNADVAVRAFLAGELEDAGVSCNHHEEEESCDCGGGCGGGCGGCGGGCHSVPSFEGPNVGKTCRVHYQGTFDDGSQFDSSYDRGEPLEFICGAGMMITGFDAAVATMEVGEIRNIHLMPSEAYGEADPNAIFTVEIDKMPGTENLTAGQHVYLQNMMGQPVPVTVVAKDDKTITFDANHEMAGKELNFKIELVEVEG